MEEQKDMFALLDMVVQPVFCVKVNKIIHVNAAARKLYLTIGDDITSLLETGAGEYADFTEGCLYLTLSISGQRIGACVRRIGGMDVFELDEDNASLQAMALAASQLRRPLGDALAQAAALQDTQEDPGTRSHISQLNRSLYQILRILGNMSDAEQMASHCRLETVDASAFLREILEKAEVLARSCGRQLYYQSLTESVFCLIDREQLERAVLNILSNAMKFTPKDGKIDISLVRRGRTLVLTVQDSGSGIAQDVMGSLFRRHLRQPGIEDSRFGLGLGIRVIHTAAIHHGGTLLISQGEKGGTKVVMTLSIRQKAPGTISSPIFEIDYAGGFDHSLVELSDVLGAELFDGSY